MAAPKGNRNAAKAKIWSAAIERALDRRKPANERIKAIDDLADKLLDLGFEGNLSALQEIGSRLEGKPAQAIEHSGEVGHRHSREMTDDELASIAASGSAGATEKAGGETDASSVH